MRVQLSLPLWEKEVLSQEGERVSLFQRGSDRYSLSLSLSARERAFQCVAVAVAVSLSVSQRGASVLFSGA